VTPPHNRPHRAIIFDADNFGFHPGVNEGIVRTHRSGVVRAASLLVTGPATADAVSLARAHPLLDLGIHLALTTVRPALQPQCVASLVTRSGRFPRLGLWLLRLGLGRLDPDDIRRELAAHVERARHKPPFHTPNSHRHDYLFPPVRAMVAMLVRQSGLPFVRWVAWRPLRPTHDVTNAAKHAVCRPRQGNKPFGRAYPSRRHAHDPAPSRRFPPAGLPQHPTGWHDRTGAFILIWWIRVLSRVDPLRAGVKRNSRG